MFRDPKIISRNSSLASKVFPLWRVISLASVLALSLGSGGQTSFVQAAPRADETIDSFDISTSPIPNPACAQTSYDVQFFARVDRVADVNGSKVNLEGGLGPSEIYVKATSSDSSIASFHPEVVNATALDGRIGKGADFLLKTEAPGSATLSFTGKIQWTGQEVIFPPLQKLIKVVHCKFKVSITSISSGFAPSVTITLVSTVTGELSGDADGTLAGDADVSWKEQQATPCLNIVTTSPPAKATMEGSLNDDGSALTVQVTYDPVMVFSTGTTTCGARTTVNEQHQFQAPPLTFTVPITGGSRSQPISLPGEMTLTGTAIITVLPIEGN